MDKFLREITKRGILYAVDPNFSHTGGHSIEQSPWELANFAQWIEDNGGLKSYMEIGVSSGGTLKFIVDMFKPERVYAADINIPRLLPPNVNFFHGNTFSPEFKAWLATIPSVDLIWIDADHKYTSVSNDYNACCIIPHKWTAFHDVCGLRNCEGSKQHWNEIKIDKDFRQWVDPQIHSQVGIGLLVNNV